MKPIFPLSVLEENGYIRIIAKDDRWLAVMSGVTLREGNDAMEIACLLVELANREHK